MLFLALATRDLSAQQPALPAPPTQTLPNPLVQSPDVVMSQCPQPLPNVPPGSTVTSGDWVELQRTPCKGDCPAYTVRLYGSGQVRWHGESSVAVRGDAIAQVDAAQAANLMQQLLDHDFLKLCGSYSRKITDNPTDVTTISVGTRVLRVSDYAQSAPVWVRDFDDRIDAAADTHRWRHGDPANELFGDLHLIEDARFAKPGKTQLMHATATPAREAVPLLLQQKVAIDAEDASGWTALMYAAGAGSLDQVRQLLAAGADATHRSRMGETLIFAAVGSRSDAVAKLLLLQRAGANVAAVSNDGTTALMMAVAYYWKPEILKTLLALGADPSARNAAGKTALDLLNARIVASGSPAEYEEARALLLHAH